MKMPVLNHETHVYSYNDMIVPGVTSIIQCLSDFSFIDASVLEYKSKLGTAVHLATELYDNDDLVFDSLDPVIKPYVIAWLKFRKDTGFIVELNEHIVFHEKYFYAGMLDRVGILNGERGVFDIKCVAQLGAHTGVQLAAYQEAENFKRKKEERIKNRFAVQLKPDATYRLQPYTDKNDFSTFVSLLNIKNWSEQHAK